MVLNDMATFVRQLEQSGRKAVVVVVPEHGAALLGDRMQIPGMREIPSPSITHVPVGIKLVGGWQYYHAVGPVNSDVGDSWAVMLGMDLRF